MSIAARSLARFIFGHESISGRMERSPFFQEIARRFRAREWINSALSRHPIRRSLAGSGVRYQIETFEALAVEKMYFGNPIYTEIFLPNPPKTFIDLGCNSGIFPCFLAHLANGSPLSGLCIDANSAQIALAHKSATLNGWQDIHFRHGLVGSRTEQGNSEFFLHSTSLGSSQFDYKESESGRPNEWKRITVPTLKVADVWTQLFGPDLRCDCLKVDIEGSEMLFLQAEAPFLHRVDSILLEWHSFATTGDQISKFLFGNGFALTHQVEETSRHGVLFFRRSQPQN